MTARKRHQSQFQVDGLEHRIALATIHHVHEFTGNGFVEGSSYQEFTTGPGGAEGRLFFDVANDPKSDIGVGADSNSPMTPEPNDEIRFPSANKPER